ncbi:MAG TPA: sulfate ABC transporter permease subunit CysW [Candidatus Binataceae bacterium]|nr:sulfate ABC transporter permease subunit CysW [Candidatus Binataceae bacterium]
MPAELSLTASFERAPARSATTEPAWVRAILIAGAMIVLLLFVLIPLFSVFYYATRNGIAACLSAIAQSDARWAIALTLFTASIAVPLNTAFGIAASWAITKFDFPGKNVLITLIDVPLAVSPVISGMILVLLFGAQGIFGAWLQSHDIHIIFALPGIVMATVFVTFPFVARELIPIMESTGSEEEEAALVLGAGGWQMFFRVTLPNIKWGLLYAVIICNARAMGEFGAVSVVSGSVRGKTITMPLFVEILYNEYNLSAAFTIASLLTSLAIATLIAKRVVGRKAVAETAVHAIVEPRRNPDEH